MHNSEQRKEIGPRGSILIGLLILGVYAYVGNEDYKEAVAQEKTASACIPDAGQMTISVREPDGRINCIVQTHPGYGQVATRIRSNCM